jgi:hypothetical protein
MLLRFFRKKPAKKKKASKKDCLLFYIKGIFAGFLLAFKSFANKKPFASFFSKKA